MTYLLATLRARYALANVDFAALLTEWGYSTYT
jgi:hypothetical protein